MEEFLLPILSVPLTTNKNAKDLANNGNEMVSRMMKMIVMQDDYEMDND